MTDFAPITDNDAALRAAINEASIPALMVSVMHLTGNTDHFRGDIRPLTDPLGEDDDSLTEEQRAPLRDIAFQALSDYRDRGCTLPAPPSEDMVLEAMHYINGFPIPDDVLPLMQEELALNGEDPRKVDIQTPTNDENFSVLVIGSGMSGMSGILSALRLKEAGIDYMIAEKNDQPAGTWWENTYPGCRVDSPNHIYSYSNAPNDDWPGYFSTQNTLFKYFDQCIDKFGIRDSIQFGTSVEKANYIPDSGTWRVDLKTNGLTETKEFSAIITATGQLNIPNFPDIKGRESFAGESFHSARWNHGVDLKGKRVAVIGTGASATQFVPIIAEDVADMVVFQRTPPWLLPTPLYHEDVSDGMHWMFQHMPYYARWYRFWLFRRDGADGALPYLRADPEWNGPENSASPENDEFRQILTDYTLEQAGEDTELASKLIPDYPPGGKRPLRDTGVWIDALRRDNVHLVDNPITEITAGSVITADGTEHEIDVLIYGTGFQADHFFTPIEFYGKDGTSLNDCWQGNPRAYKGITIPNFPNLFVTYGPNTNIVVGTSIIFFTECEVRYIMQCLDTLASNGASAMECRKDVHDTYNEVIDKGNLLRAWGAPNVRSWYKNEAGRVTQNWPGTHFEYWQETRTVNAADYIFT
jgi:4-hydroxyacetophenone monooxygenase